MIVLVHTLFDCSEGVGKGLESQEMLNVVNVMANGATNIKSDQE